MAKKTLIAITEEKSLNPEFKTFEISFARQILGLVFYGAFDLRTFNNNGYLQKLVENFHEKDKAGFIMFSSFGGVRGASEVSIDKVLSMTDSYIALEPITPDKLSEKIFFSSPNPIYFLIMEELIFRVKEIFDCIDSIDTRFIMVWDSAENKAAVYKQIRELHKNKNLGEEGFVSLKLDSILLKFGKYGAGETFRIITHRFKMEDMKKMIEDSVDLTKFEVKIK